MELSKVNFFIVGAPKTGTTSLHYYLKQHPEIFLPNIKDRPFFGKDIYPDMSVSEHKRIYSATKGKEFIGESCVWYLYSSTAAKEIHSYNPKAKIIIMLRDPVELLHSLHNQLVFNQVESIRNFSKALEAEGKGEGQPNEFWGRNYLNYGDIVKFSKQIRRYYSLFGKRNVHIIIFDDFIKDTEKVYENTLIFLGVNDIDFKPLFKIYNASKKTHSKSLQRFVYHPPIILRKLTHTFLGYKIRYVLVNILLKLNSSHNPRPKLPVKLRKKLIKKYGPETKRLEKLLGRDLSSWYSA